LIFASDLNIDVTKSSKWTSALLNVSRLHGVYCANDMPTRGKACLDNILTNLNNWDYKVFVTEPALSDHRAVNMKILCDIKAVKNELKECRPYEYRPHTNSRINCFSQALETITWSTSLCFPDANDNFNCFFDKIMHCYNFSFPIVQRNRKAMQNKPLFSGTLRKMRDKVTMLYNIQQAFPSLENRNYYKQHKKDYKAAIIKARKESNGIELLNSSNQCKTAWNIAKRVAGGFLNKCHGADCMPFTADEFHNYLDCSVADILHKLRLPGTPPEDYLTNVSSPAYTLIWRSVTMKEVYGVINSLSNSKARDFYGFSNSLIKQTATALLEPLTILINQCLEQGVFPDRIKISKIHPAFKKGDKKSIDNYRPISLVPIIGKILEKVILNQLQAHFEDNQLLQHEQYGYRKGLSTTHALTDFIRKILEEWNNRESVVVSLCDLSKAFDCLPHQMLLYKLNHYGVKGKENDIMASYLNGLITGCKW